jgi:hypothetical protein
MHSCVVSFAPGTAGHFIGGICQYLLYSSEIKINADGSCHNNGTHWCTEPLVIENSGKAMSHEIETIHTSLMPVPNRVTVTHSRNLFELSKLYDKTIYIEFNEQDVDIISKKFQKKALTDYREPLSPNRKPIGESDYNNIKDASWPEYNVYAIGGAAEYIYQEIEFITSVGMYHDWSWLMPALTVSKCIKKVEFSNIFGREPTWIYDLAEFLAYNTATRSISYVIESWEKYKALQ